MPKEEGDIIREYKAMHGENFLNSWLREEGKDREVRIMETDKESEEEASKKRTREEEKEENETVSAKRCVGSVSAETFDIFSQGAYSESCGGFSWGDLLKDPDDLPETRTEVPAVPDVTVVPVSPSSVVTDLFEDVSLDSDWELVEHLLNRSPLLPPRSVLSSGQFHRKR